MMLSSTEIISQFDGKNMCLENTYFRLVNRFCISRSALCGEKGLPIKVRTYRSGQISEVKFQNEIF